MAKRKFTVMVPVEVTVHDENYRLTWLYRDFRDRGPYPSVSGGNCSWKTRFDKIKLSDIENSAKGKKGNQHER